MQDPNDVCKSLEGGPVMGVSVHLTSNRVNHADNIDYETFPSGEGPRPKETVRQLGFYDVTGQSDTSFQAMIPSHSPFEFHLIDSNYGLRLADVRGWHSLYPREVRTDCGGCHQHDPSGPAYAFKNTAADSLGPLDMVTETQRVTYDSTCTPVVVALSQLSLTNPQIVKVIATDAAGNRQIYEKKVKQLKDECTPAVLFEVDPIPLP